MKFRVDRELGTIEAVKDGRTLYALFDPASTEDMWNKIEELRKKGESM